MGCSDDCFDDDSLEVGELIMWNQNQVVRDQVTRGKPPIDALFGYAVEAIEALLDKRLRAADKKDAQELDDLKHLLKEKSGELDSLNSLLKEKSEIIKSLNEKQPVAYEVGLNFINSLSIGDVINTNNTNFLVVRKVSMFCDVVLCRKFLGRTNSKWTKTVYEVPLKLASLGHVRPTSEGDPYHGLNVASPRTLGHNFDN